MNINMPYMLHIYGYSNCKTLSSYKTLFEALTLVKQAVQGEREDELFYDYLISIAQTKEEKDIIATIRDDERKHNRIFREIYKFFTGETINTLKEIDFEKPKSYIDGIKKAKFGELATVERYRVIHAGLPNKYFRDMAFEILADELKHAHKYDYIIIINLERKLEGIQMQSSTPGTTDMVKKSFTLEEAAHIAKVLEIDFSKEKFNLEQFRMGLNVELEHGRRDPFTNVTGDDPILTGKIALAHLNEFPDYYTRLAKLEEEAKAYWYTSRESIEQAET